ncbi:MAG: hypothetical protein C5B43_03160 [Verrucomicrobia bacterium]|nr:MAG: hypothetical protein C5B43_03160 [Verrucomicrobiota bacterium]
MNKCVAIIDIGTNSIKLLVANQERTLLDTIRGSRIGEGIAQKKFIISKPIIERNIQAIHELLNEAEAFKPDHVIITGTSAVRDAENSKEFCQEVKKATGYDVRVLSGEEEATIIAKGVATDPNVEAFNEFCHFDLGGGSLECIHYQNQPESRVLFAESYPLGIVRLTEKFITNPAIKIPQKELLRVQDFIEEELPNFPIKNLPLVATGGGLSTTKNILKTGPILHLNDLEDLLNILSNITVEERIAVYQIPTFRADVMPTALMIIITLAKKANAKSIIHSSFNLRYGLAEEYFRSTS